MKGRSFVGQEGRLFNPMSEIAWNMAQGIVRNPSRAGEGCCILRLMHRTCVSNCTALWRQLIHDSATMS
jgi:hypothetical protein